MAAPERATPEGRLPERQPVFGRPTEANSLFGEILDWMLAPLLLLWPISIAATHHVANEIANEPYDQALAENVEAIARLVHLDGGRVVVNLPASARLQPGQKRVQVQVAETLKKRQGLASRVISGVLLPQFAIIPLAVILVWLGLSRGLAPLNRLRRKIGERRPGDLSPLRTRGVPEELQPMIRSFNELMGRLEENLHAQQRFIADAAHQMKTPLTGLKMQAELAAAETDPEQLRRSAEQIARSADQASHLIHQLLTLARAESSHDKVHQFVVTDLEALAREAARDWVPRAIAKNIDLGFEGIDRPLLIDAVPLLLRQMLDNLIDNAIKYTPSGGQVTVHTVDGELLAVEVADSGMGVPPEDRRRVFERFYRVLGTGEEGSGLGLPICAEIAELHRAAISLGPGDGDQGTRVVVVFPRSRVGSSRVITAT